MPSKCDLPRLEHRQLSWAVACSCALVLLLGHSGSAPAQKIDHPAIAPVQKVDRGVLDLSPMFLPDRGGYGAATLVSAGLTPTTGPVAQIATFW